MAWRKYLVLILTLALTVCACLPVLAADEASSESGAAESVEEIQPEKAPAKDSPSAAASKPRPAPEPEPEPAPEPEPERQPEAKPAPEAKPELTSEPEAEPEPTPDPAPEPMPESMRDAEPAPDMGLQSAAKALDEPSDVERSAVIRLKTSGGEAISGATVKYYDAGWKVAGTTNADGVVALELSKVNNPAAARISVEYRHKTLEKLCDLTKGSVTFNTVPVIVELRDSKGNILDGGSVSFYASGWRSLGSANTRYELLPGSYRFKMSYKYTEVTQDEVISDDREVQTFAFNTVPVTISLKDHKGYPLDGGSVSFYASGWRSLGNANTEFELLPEDKDFECMMSHNHLSQKKLLNPARDDALEFKTGLVDIRLAGGSVNYYASGYRSHKQATEYLPVEMDFRFSGKGFPEVSQSITPIEGKSIVYNVAYLYATNSKGAGLQNVGIDYYDTKWHNAGTANNDGIKLMLFEAGRTSYTFRATYLGGKLQTKQDIALNGFVTFRSAPVRVNLFSSTGEELSGEVSYYAESWKTLGYSNNAFELFPGEYTFKMKYLDADQSIKRNVAENPTLDFRTTAVTVKLIDSKGNPLDGGSVKFYSRNWFDFGEANTTLELLPFDYTFEMRYLDGLQQKKLPVSGTSSEVTFQTGRVDLRLAGGSISFYTHNWFKYNGPVELLPVETTFKFSGGGFKDMSIKKIWAHEGESYVSNVAMVRVIDSNKKGIEGVPISVFDWQWNNDIGSTGANGQWIYFGTQRSQYSFTASISGSKQQIDRNIATDGFITFQTSPATLQLFDSSGKALKADAFEYYKNGTWIPFGIGETSARVEMLPGRYSFAVRYNGARQQYNDQVVGTNTVIRFSTTPVEVRFQDSKGNPLEGNLVEYYANGWRPLGTTDSSGAVTAEMLPYNYSLRVNYNGARQQYSDQIVGTDKKDVLFTTTPVEVRFQDSKGNPLEGNLIEYFTNEWRPLGTTDSSGAVTAEMLPYNYSLRVNYNGARQQYSNQVVGTDKKVVQFKTISAEIHVQDPDGNALGGAQVSYYASEWRALGTSDETGVVQAEILSGTYSFATHYNGARRQFNNCVVGDDPLFLIIP